MRVEKGLIVMIKKTISLCLALVLVFALAVPLSALAAEESPPSEPASPTPREVSPLWEEWGFESLEELLETIGMTEEEYYKFVAEQRQYQEDQIRREEEYVQEYRQRRIKEFEELGGTYGTINVMFNGEFIRFSEAIPEIAGDSLFVPAVPFFEAMGAAASFDHETLEITAEFPDRAIYLVLGQDKMTIAENGEESEIPIDAPAYAGNGDSYISARAVSEALGYDVYWDSEFKTAVILDSEGIIAEIDKDFTILNKLFQTPIEMIPNDGSVYRMIIDILASVTLFDSLDGDSSVDVGANISIHSDGSSFYFKGVVDLSGLLGFLQGDYDYNVFSAEDIKEITDIFNAISAAEIELIYNYDKDILYVKIPFLHMAFPEIPENSWISLNKAFEQLFGTEMSSIFEELGSDSLDALASGMSVGRLVYLESQSYSYYNQVYLFKNIMANAEELKALVGDGKFERNGTDYTLTMTQDDMDDIYYYYSRFYFTLTIKTQDDAVSGIAGSVIYRMGYYNTVTQISADFDISAGSLVFSCEVHEKNTMVVRLDVGAEAEATGEPVPKAPPDGANIIPIEELFPNEFEYPAIMQVSDNK